MGFLVGLCFVILFVLCVPFRVAVLHPFCTVFYGLMDFYRWLRYCKWRNASDGYIYCFIGLFGKGKTLASVHYVLTQYKKKNGKKVYDFERKKWVTQRINIVSNVVLAIPYVEFTGLQQIVDISKSMRAYDDEHDTKTITLVLGDEFSVQLNSRQFKTNIDPLFLNTLLTCRHHHIAIVYNAQRFGHVDALMRQVTYRVIDCNKVWRFMCHKEYDAWDLENASTPTNCKPLRRYGWFVKNKDFDAYDTLACVGNLIKSCEDGDMLSEEEILSLQAKNCSDMEVVSKPSKRYMKSIRKRK